MSHVSRLGLSQLDALLRECRATGVHRLHIEFDGSAARVRLRQPDGLDTRRFDPADALADALTQLRASGIDPRSDGGEDGDPLTCSLTLSDGRTLSIELWHVRASGGDSWQLLLHAQLPACTSLDRLVRDRVARERIQATLSRRRGLVVIAGDEPERLQPLANALAACCIAPDRKVLRIQTEVRQTLPGAVQVPLSSIDPARQAATCRALLSHDADVIVADAVLPPGIGQLLDALSSHRLVVRELRTSVEGDLLSGLRANGGEGPWVAEHLQLALRVDLVRRLCPACARPIVPPIDDGTTTGISPARQLLALSLNRFAVADGCEACHDSGVGRVELRVDATGIDERMRDLLRCDDFDGAQRALDAARRLPDYALALMRKGELSLQEAARLGVH